MGIFFTGDLLLELCGSTASNRWEEEILEGKVLTFDSVFFLPIKNVDQTKKFLTCKKSMLLKEEWYISWDMCHSWYCKSSAFVLSCLRGYFTGHKFFLVGILCVWSFFFWVFRGFDFQIVIFVVVGCWEIRNT